MCRSIIKRVNALSKEKIMTLTFRSASIAAVVIYAAGLAGCAVFDYEQRQTAPFYYTKKSICSDSELKYISERILQVVNAERKKTGRSLLEWDSGLASVAASHSADMVRRKFFAHVNPDGEDAIARAERMGVPSYSAKGSWKIGVGENVGMLSRGNLKGYGEIRTSEDIATVMMDIWMKSSGHRENILSSDYRLLGVGVVCNPTGTYYFTQNFR